MNRGVQPSIPSRDFLEGGGWSLTQSPMANDLIDSVYGVKPPETQKDGVCERPGWGPENAHVPPGGAPSRRRSTFVWDLTAAAMCLFT